MGTAWANSLSYPWEHGYYVGGIETVKVNIMLRIYANQWHVSAGWPSSTLRTTSSGSA